MIGMEAAGAQGRESISAGAGIKIFGVIYVKSSFRHNFSPCAPFDLFSVLSWPL